MYLSDLWRMEKFLTKQKIENIMKCKMDNFDYIKLKSFAQPNPMQPRLGGKQKTGKEFLQLVSVIKTSFLNYVENWVKCTRIQVIPQMINGQRI